jgi:hypothetical protein
MFMILVGADGSCGLLGIWMPFVARSERGLVLARLIQG